MVSTRTLPQLEQIDGLICDRENEFGFISRSQDRVIEVIKAIRAEIPEAQAPALKVDKGDISFLRLNTSKAFMPAASHSP